MNNEHKHLANTLIEIPKETIQQWNLEAQKYSMEHYNRVESAIVELYMKLKTETFRIIERNKNTQAELVAEYVVIVAERQRIISERDKSIEILKSDSLHSKAMIVELQETIEDLKSQRENKEKDYKELEANIESLKRQIK